ncbi:MAG TPA: diaminopimelate decarboxylase, partial [Lachnospiraceae bacterium]|nr:diaminopimelate decarboxylase [Lachnospiraceae bacterium]
MMKKAFLSKEKALEIAAEYPTPYIVYDEKGIRENLEKVRKAFSWNKGFREYFAVKACPNPFLIRLMRDYDCGVDCSSYTELMLSDVIGFKNREIMFSSNDTPLEEYAYALKLGAIINLDDITHISFLESITGDGGFPETMSCRFNPGGLFELSNG